MFTLYVLYSEKHNIHYISYISNIIERIKSHNELATKEFTIKYRHWKLIYSEEFQTKSEAMKREKHFKSGAGRAFIKSILH